MSHLISRYVNVLKLRPLVDKEVVDLEMESRRTEAVTMSTDPNLYL